MGRIMSASLLIEVPLGLCSFLMIYSGIVLVYIQLKHKADGSIDLVTPQQGKDMCLSLKPSNRKAAMLLYFQVCMNLGNVSKLPLISFLSLIMFSELNQLTGIAAILTFPLDVEMVEAEEREEVEARKRQEEEKESGLEMPNRCV